MQFSLFGAEASEVLLADLDGVLLGGGQWRSGPDGVRLSAVVDRRWRANALADAFTALDIADPEPIGAADPEPIGPADPEPIGAAEPGPARSVDRPLPDDGSFVARTRATPVLRPLETRWRRGATIAPPDDLTVSAAGLRLWAVTAGITDDVGYVLRTPEVTDAAGPSGRLHRIAGAVLARTGIAAVELGTRGGPGWRVTSARRLRRLAELIGPPPPGAEHDWPVPDLSGAGRTTHRL